MSYSDQNQNSVLESYITPTNDTNSTEAALKHKLNQNLIYSICFTFIVLFVLHVIYLRQRSISVDWSFLGMHGDGSFVCSVCLGDYQADEKLQQIPACGHTFHMDCIDLWLTSHTTCLLCRLSLIPKTSLDRPHQNLELVSSINNSDGGGVPAQIESRSIGEVVSLIDDGQDGDSDSGEVFKETEENDQPRRDI
ncbi:hypothetical protein Bca101_019974 [Brassica carinata]